jgi:hypothetical protein
MLPRQVVFSFCLMSFLALMTLSCATTGKFIDLNLDMSKQQVIGTLGKPDVARGSIRNRWGQLIEVWEYVEYASDDDAFYGFHTKYWVYFCDGKLVQWGQAGDWKTEADRIYEIRYR